jgi:hypothetical protein
MVHWSDGFLYNPTLGSAREQLVRVGKLMVPVQLVIWELRRGW